MTRRRVVVCWWWGRHQGTCEAAATLLGGHDCGSRSGLKARPFPWFRRGRSLEWQRARQHRFTVWLPEPSEFTRDRAGRYVFEEKRKRSLCEAEERRRWRVLLLVLKGKLAAVASGAVTLDEEFLPYIVTDSGETVGERIIPQLAKLTAGVPSLSAGR